MNILCKRDGLCASLRWQHLPTPAVQACLEHNIFQHVLGFPLPVHIFPTDMPIIIIALVDAILLETGLKVADQRALIFPYVAHE
jgi:hypothetical protein